ncbi:uncharacterized protein BXIN_0606 [Babesia sp. Xinjiang]|uniref:uncharacterized protein n=1 Tax=Babesia sp. Xinjiang TaxID=462227 RepID=UPI000A2396D8|nr:uncharacterized protein BXIN_0606 [Babesia sp. Xinjiang]ORM41783.1 hypothetical protein BXIN_0606 [Babesia sp. Xinjiang]
MLIVHLRQTGAFVIGGTNLGASIHGMVSLSDIANPVLPPWKELIDPSTGSVYYWNTVTSETSWERPVCAELSADAPQCDKGASPQNSSNVAEKWLSTYLSATSTSDRIVLFFSGLELIRAGIEADDAAHHENAQHEAARLLELIDSALASLSEILETASAGTRSYVKLAGYKAQLERQRKIAISSNSSNRTIYPENIGEICDEVAKLSSNLRELTQSRASGTPNHFSALCDDYSIYMKRKRQSALRERWAQFKESRRQKEECADSQHDPGPEAEIDDNAPTTVESVARRAKAFDKARQLQKRWAQAASMLYDDTGWHEKIGQRESAGPAS